jgi:transcriptional regulator with XRE-family HTH domain/tetratricopeptide (TPR) repeat protein
MAELGPRLRRYREAAGLSQEELAERAGLSGRAISDIERGLRRSPYPSTVRRLAVALDLGDDDRAMLLAAAQAPSRQVPSNTVLQAGQGAYLGASASLRLVGRQSEVRQLEDALGSALHGTGQLLLLTGEAGIGKTRLAQELAALVAGRGWIVTTGRCYEPQQGVAFHPFLDALATLYACAPAAVRQTLPERWPYVQRLLPDVFPMSPAAASDNADELQRLLRSTAGFVRACAGTTPVALLIDDLQWADRASVDLLQHLVRHTRGEPVLLAATAREPELDSAVSLRRALVDLRREGLIHRVRLEPFEGGQTADLVAQVLGTRDLAPEFIQTVHAVSGGNPFFAIEIVQTLRGRVDQQWSGVGVECLEVPETVRENILERLAHVSPASAEALDAATTFGQAFLVDEVAALLAADPADVDVALQEAIEIGLIRAPTGTADVHYTFVHALTHQALYERLSPHRRRRLHLRAAEVLEGLPEAMRRKRAGELAHHFEAAEQPQRALPYLMMAGDQAEALFAHHEARQRYQTAAQIASRLGDLSAEARSLLGVGRSWLAAGRPGRALEHFEAAVRAFGRLDDAEGEAEALARVAQVYFARGKWDMGIERLPAMIERLEQRQPSRALALLYASLAMVMPADVGERVRAAERASELARSLWDEDLLVQAEAGRGFVLMLAGRLPEAREVLEGILPLADERRSYDALSTIIGVLAELNKMQGNIHGYLSLSQLGVARAEEAGDLVAAVGALSGMAEAQFLMGDWPAARATYMHAEHEISGVDAAWYRGFVQLGLAAMDVAQGDSVTAEERLRDCLVETQRLGHHNRREHAQRLLAWRDLLAEQPAAALERLEEVMRVEGDQHAGTQALRAWALLQSGDASQAAATVARAVELASRQGNQLDLCEALLVRGLVERRAGDTRAAASSLVDALALAQAMSSPYVEGRVRYARAELLADLGQLDEALHEVELAIAIFTRLGARPCLHKSERRAVALAVSSGGGSGDERHSPSSRAR